MSVFDINLFGSSKTVPETTLDEETVFNVLGNFRRRAVIYYTVNNNNENKPISLTQLTEKIAHSEGVRDDTILLNEQDTHPDIEKGGRVYQSVYISLTQRHLPFLHTANIISYDDAEKTITVDTEAEAFKYMIQCLTEINAIDPEEFPD